ncbi:unnamed protein product [Blepharisma stoltei]|uniref:Uncharacterized protein n=1 Tax=Blepharisma stoltei TaxID=1481888 RepID=A0AAU9JHW0_9CILI|nr:unnamed protein product [Blepharisma stoltei]
MKERDIPTLIRLAKTGINLSTFEKDNREKLENLVTDLENEMKTVLVMYKLKENESLSKMNRYTDELALSLPDNIKQMRLEDYCKFKTEEELF